MQNYVITKAVLDMNTMEWICVEGYKYDGPWELADRAAVNEAKSAEKTAAGVGEEAGATATGERAALTPFYRQEMQAQHLYSPGQLNQLLGAAGAGVGGAAATSAGQLASEAARTRNTAGLSSALDENARNRMRTMGELNLGVGAQDVMGAKDLQQRGAEGMQGLYGTDVNRQLSAMGLRDKAINTQLEAGKSGWFQNMTGMLGTLAGMGKAATGAYSDLYGGK
jgi:hypothetical protein